MGRNQLLLKGYVPSEDLAKRAIALISAQTSALPIENQVVVIQTPPPPSRETLNPKDVDAAVRRTARVLNEIEGIFLSARFENGVVQIDSVTRSLQQVKIIDQAFQDIPGVALVQHTTRIQ